MNLKFKRKNLFISLTIIFLIISALPIWLFVVPFSLQADPVVLYIDKDDNADSVREKIIEQIKPSTILAYDLLSSLSNYKNKVKIGRYEIKPGATAFSVLHKLKSGRQTPLNLTIPSVWTKEIAASKITARLMLDSLELSAALNDSALCAQYNLNSQTISTLIIPNTYQVYWTISAKELIERLHTESEHFWSPERKKKAEQLGLSRVEIITLASIVDAETASNQEKPLIAGLYLNRLKIGMPLQSDPTIKFALGNFTLRRIYSEMLHTPSPYNTYINKGLPPGPIRIPQVSSIDAVLSPANHNYLYMCANSDFSGTHKFAATYAEHLHNAQQYIKALNQRNIK